jgi:hypothetical protein
VGEKMATEVSAATAGEQKKDLLDNPLLVRVLQKQGR